MSRLRFDPGRRCTYICPAQMDAPTGGTSMTGGAPMPAAVLVVHDDQNIRDLAVSALRAVFLDAIGFDDPMVALDAIEASSRVRVLVTRVAFGPGKPNGVALARMVRLK